MQCNKKFIRVTIKTITMRNYLKTIAGLAIASALMASCGNSSSPEAIAQQWCELNLKEYQTAGPEKEAATAAKKAFEKEVDDKYFGKADFYAAVLNAMEDCETSLRNSENDTSYTTNTNEEASLVPAVEGNVAAIAETWCQLMRLEFRARNKGDAENIKATASAVTAYQNKIEEKYGNDQAMISDILENMASCDAALEGRR